MKPPPSGSPARFDRGERRVRGGVGAEEEEEGKLKYTRVPRRATHGRTHKESNSGFHGRGGMTESIPVCERVG